MMVGAHLSKELKAKLGTKKRAISLRKGDKVRVIRGKYKGKEGVVAKASTKTAKIYIEGITVKNARGKEVLVPFDASNLLITELSLNEERKAKLSR